MEACSRPDARRPDLTLILALMLDGTDTLENGEPVSLSLDRRGAMIGRSAHADWSLPDPKNHISARHCEISYRDGVYLLADRSTNGTFVNGSTSRLNALHPIADGDRITIGGYEIIARLYGPDQADDGGASQSEASPPSGWESGPSRHAAARPAWSDWNHAAPSSGWSDAHCSVSSPANEKFPRVSPPLPDGGGWDTPAPLSRPSVWSSEPPEPTPPTAQDIWGRLAEGNAIDWTRGDFGAIPQSPGAWGVVAAPPAQPAVDDPTPARRSETAASSATSAPPKPFDQSAAQESLEAPPRERAPLDGWSAFLHGTALPVEQVHSSPAEVLAQAGAVLRQMVSGLILMMDARARAKAQMGLQATSLELDGNNPLKFMRSPEQALLHMLEPPQRGFMGATRAVEDAYQDLQAHQMATLGAMRGALAEALARFSPAAIRRRRSAPGWLARLLPGADDAALWQAYERDFEGVVRGADEAFMDVFAKEFRTAYEQQIAAMNARRAER